MKDATLADKPEKGVVLVRVGDTYNLQKKTENLQKKSELVYDGEATLTERLLEGGGKKCASITLYANPFLTSPNNYFNSFKNIFDGGRLELSYPNYEIELNAAEKDCLTKMFPFEFCGKFENQDVKGRIAAKSMSEGESVRIDVDFDGAPNKNLLRSIGKMLLKIKPDTLYISRKEGYETLESIINPKEEEADIFEMNPRNFDKTKLPIEC